MSFNLIDLVKDQISDQLIDQIGGVLGESSDRTRQSIGGAVPAVLSGLVGAAGSTKGAESIFEAISGQKDDTLDNIGSMLGGNDRDGFIESGSKILGSLFGNSGLGNLIGAVAGFSGLSKGSSGSLLGIIAPLVLGVIKRKVFGEGLNAGGLANMLMGQKDNISNAMPSGLSDQINSSGFFDDIGNVFKDGLDSAAEAASSVAGAAGDVASGVANAASNTASNVAGAAGSAASNVAGAASEATSAGSSLIKKVLPIVIILILVYLAMKLFSGSGEDVVDKTTEAVSEAASSATEVVSEAASSAAETVSEVASDATEAASEVASSATEAVSEAASGAAETVSGAASDATEAASDVMDSAKNLMVGDIDFGGELGSVFSSVTDSLSGITDVASAEAAVPGLNDITSKLDGLSGMFDRLPDAGKSAVASLTTEGSDKLQTVIDKVLAIPGVKTIIEPLVNTIMEKLKAFSG